MSGSEDKSPLPQPGQLGPVYYWIPPPQQQQPAQPWKPEEVNALLEKLLPYADKIMDYVKQTAESQQKLTQLATAHDWRTNVVAYAFLSIIIGLMSLLTYLGKVSGDALLFLAGTATGYIFITISKFRWPANLKPKNEEDD